MQEALTGAGVSANGAAFPIQKIADAVEKAKLGQVTNAIQKWRQPATSSHSRRTRAQAAEAGGRAIPQFGVEAAKQFKVIEEAAKGAGPDAEAARAELGRLASRSPRGRKVGR